MRKVIFDLDLTLVDTTVVEQARHDRNWSLAYSLIPNCVVYDGMEKILDVIRKHNIDACIVSTSPRTYVENVVKHFNIPISKIVAYHDASQSTSNINYTEQHYIQALENKTRYQDDDIASAARNNLALLDSLGDN